MRVEVARLRAQRDWDQDELLNELILHIREYSQKLTFDILNLACERLDSDHLMTLWRRSGEFLGSKLQRRFLSDLRHKSRFDVLRKILHGYFTDAEEPLSTEAMLELIHKWRRYLDRDTVLSYLRQVPIQNKWVFFDKLNAKSFEYFADYVKDELFDELYQEDPQACVSSFTQKPCWLIKDAAWQKKWFHAEFEKRGTYSVPPVNLLDEHFGWYVNLLRAGAVTELRSLHYPIDLYLLERRSRAHRSRNWWLATSKVRTNLLYERIQKVIELMDEDLRVCFRWSNFSSQQLLVRLRQNPELSLRLWRSFIRRMKRAAIEEFGCTTIPKDCTEWNSEKLYLRHFGATQMVMVELLSEAPSEIFREVRDMLVEFDGVSKTVVDLLREYKNQDLPWIPFVRNRNPLDSPTLNAVQTISEQICRIAHTLRQPGTISNGIPYLWLEGTHEPNFFSSYDELYEDIEKNIDLAQLYEAVIATESDSSTVADEIVRLIRCPSSSAPPANLQAILSCADYLKKFRNDLEGNAALVLMSEMIRSVHPESILTSYENWWGGVCGARSTPYPNKQPTPGETLQFVDSLFQLDETQLEKFAEQMTWLPYENAESWVAGKTILTKLSAPENLSKTETALLHIQRMIRFSQYVDRLIKLGPTMIYTLSFVFVKYIIPTFLQLPARDRDAKMRFPKMTFSQLDGRKLRVHQEAVNKFLLFTRLWQNKIVYGGAESFPASHVRADRDKNCLAYHLFQLSGHHSKNLVEPWCGPSAYSSQQTEIYIPYNLLCLKYPTLTQPESNFCSPRTTTSGMRNMSLSVIKLLESLSNLVESSDPSYKVLKLHGVNIYENLDRLQHRSHRNNKRCDACVKRYWVSTSNFRNSRCLEFLCRAGLSKPLLVAALKCDKLEKCDLAKDLRSHSKIFELPRNHLEFIEFEQQRSIRAEHAPCELGNLIRFGLPEPELGTDDMTDLELYLLLEIFTISRISASPTTPVKLLTPAIKQLGNYLKTKQLKLLIAKIISLIDHLPTILAHQDDMKKTLAQLTSDYLKNMQSAPGGLRSLKQLIPYLPKSEILEPLESANTTLIRAEKMKWECMVKLEGENLLARLCIGEASPEKIKRLKAISDSVRVLLGGLHADALEVPDILLCLKRLNGVDYNSALNGSLGDGSGLARILKPPGKSWNITDLAKAARVRLACNLLVADNVKVIGAAFKCLEVLRPEEPVRATEEEDRIIHSRKRPDLSYLSKIRLYVKIDDPKIVAQYLDYMREKNFSIPSIVTWLIGVVERNNIDSPELHNLIAREVAVGILAFGQEYSRMNSRTNKLFPECAIFDTVYY